MNNLNFQGGAKIPDCLFSKSSRCHKIRIMVRGQLPLSIPTLPLQGGQNTDVGKPF